MKGFIIVGIRFYRRWISPVFPGSCRFFPTCSAFAMEAISRKGAMKGSLVAVRRLVKCHPWHPGGYDPVLPDNDDYEPQNPKLKEPLI